jgi:hypothetical protein
VYRRLQSPIPKAATEVAGTERIRKAFALF